LPSVRLAASYQRGQAHALEACKQVWVRREADIALRPVRPREGDLWGRRLAAVAWTVYAARSVLERSGALARAQELGAHGLIGWDETASGILAADWLSEIAPTEAFVYAPAASLTSCWLRRPALGLRCCPAIWATPSPK
jgi:hypothetical protein